MTAPGPGAGRVVGNVAVGDRVVVRHTVATGGVTDVIGILTVLADPIVVTRDGTDHRINHDSVVAIKRVPARGVRTSEIRALDLARVRGWMSVRHEWIDGWLCRAAPSLRGQRANCATPLHPEASLHNLDAVRGWLADQGLPTRLSLSSRVLPDAPVPDRLIDVLTAPSSTTERRSGGADLAPTADADWLAVTGADAALVQSAAGTVTFASVRRDGATVAAGRLAVTADAAGKLWGGIGSVAVAREHRRRGYATEIMHTLMAAAADAGAPRVYLEVERDNPGARLLYRQLGFTDHHSYGFWIAP